MKIRGHNVQPIEPQAELPKFHAGPYRQAQAPAFQFYASDWLSSPTVLGMTLAEQGLYIRLLALSWTSQEPGTLPLPMQVCAKLASIRTQTLRKFAAKFTHAFVEFDGKLVNVKLRNQWLELQELKRRQSVAGKSGNEKRWKASVGCRSDSDRPSSSSSSSINTTPYSPPRGTRYSDAFLEFWKSYPRKVGKEAAWKAWQSAKINGEAGEIIASVHDHASWPQWSDPQYIPHPATFLNQHRWLDEKPESKSADLDERELAELRRKAEDWDGRI